jgi:hypothetical protein
MWKTWKDVEVKLAFYFKETWLYRVTGCYTYTVVIGYKSTMNIELYLLYWSILRYLYIEFLTYWSNKLSDIVIGYVLKILNIGMPHENSMWIGARNEITAEILLSIPEVIKFLCSFNEFSESTDTEDFLWFGKFGKCLSLSTCLSGHFLIVFCYKFR